MITWRTSTWNWTCEYFERGFVFRSLRMHHLAISAQTWAVVHKDHQITRRVSTEVQSSASIPCYDLGRHLCMLWTCIMRWRCWNRSICFILCSVPWQNIFSSKNISFYNTLWGREYATWDEKIASWARVRISMYRTPWGRYPLQTIIAQLVKKFPSLYGNWWSITGVRYLSLFWAKRSQTATWHTIPPGLLLIYSFHLFLGHPNNLL
jgi:hypothetical protein